MRSVMNKLFCKQPQKAQQVTHASLAVLPHCGLMTSSSGAEMMKVKYCYFPLSNTRKYKEFIQHDCCIGRKLLFKKSDFCISPLLIISSINFECLFQPLLLEFCIFRIIYPPTNHLYLAKSLIAQLICLRQRKYHVGGSCSQKIACVKVRGQRSEVRPGKDHSKAKGITACSQCTHTLVHLIRHPILVKWDTCGGIYTYTKDSDHPPQKHHRRSVLPVLTSFFLYAIPLFYYIHLHSFDSPFYS